MTRRMRTGKSGLKLIKSFEGFSARAASIGSGTWVIGHGHTRSARAGLRISPVDADMLLREYDLPPIERTVQGAIHAPIRQNEFDALVSFTFNIGRDAFLQSAVLDHLNAGEPLAAAEAMAAWRVAELNGRVTLVDALVRRRAAEVALFLSPAGGPVQAASARLKPIRDQSMRAGGLIHAQPAMPAMASNSLDERLFENVSEPVLTPLDDEGVTSSVPSPVHPPLSPTAPEATARAVTERLTRILGETGTERELPPVDDTTPSPDEITRAISALADPNGSGPNILERSQSGDATYPRSNGKVVIDDLETVAADPALLQAALSREAQEGADLESGRISLVFYGILSLLGVALAALGLSRLLSLFNEPAGAGAGGTLYTSVFLLLLGGVITLLAVYFMIKPLIRGRD